MKFLVFIVTKIIFYLDNHRKKIQQSMNFSQIIPIFCECGGIVFGKFASKNVICTNCEKESVLEEIPRL